jgi:hypothetical protein
MAETTTVKQGDPEKGFSTFRDLVRQRFMRRFARDDDSKEVRWSTYQAVAIVTGTLILVAFSVRALTPWQTLAISLLIAGGSLATGLLIGFLFGIPRTLQREQKADSAGVDAVGGAYGVNTNLEQISDWLTKIIVGVGLVQLTVIPGRLRSLAEYLATGFGAPAVPSAIVITIICYFGIFGFLLGYLWTRIYLMGEFSRVERITRERPEFYEGLIHAYLYQPMPASFLSAITEGEEYCLRFGDNWRVWLYLACAYAQYYSYLCRDPKPDESKKQELKKKALLAVQRVLQINPDAKKLLRGFWNPKETNPLENDLEIFWDEKDEEFLKWLGEKGERFEEEGAEKEAAEEEVPEEAGQ